MRKKKKDERREDEGHTRARAHTHTHTLAWKSEEGRHTASKIKRQNLINHRKVFGRVEILGRDLLVWVIFVYWI